MAYIVAVILFDLLRSTAPYTSYGATTERLSPDGEWVVASEETSLMRERGEATDAFQIRVKRWAGLLIHAQLGLA